MSDLPYPGSSTVTNHTSQQSSGWIMGPILGAILLAGGYGASKLISPAVPTIPPPIAAAAKSYLFDEIEQVLQADGTWKNTGKVTRKRMNADGTVVTVTPQ